MDRVNSWATTLVVKFHELKNREQGQGLVEYGLILFLVSVAAVVGLTSVGQSVSSVISKVATDI